MSITTKRGDAGQTDLMGARVGKDHILIELVGVLDELNAAIGVAAVHTSGADRQGMLRVIQAQLFVLGAEAASVPSTARERLLRLQDAELALLDGYRETLEGELPPLTTFILPGGSAAGASIHLARAVSRRAERCLVVAAQGHPSLGHAVPYLNRLSDVLFLLARAANRDDGAEEVAWKGTA